VKAEPGKDGLTQRRGDAERKKREREELELDLLSSVLSLRLCVSA
jgi:hypothetical protein